MPFTLNQANHMPFKLNSANQNSQADNRELSELSGISCWLFIIKELAALTRALCTKLLFALFYMFGDSVTLTQLFS
jgi:hypothetical protein